MKSAHNAYVAAVIFLFTAFSSMAASLSAGSEICLGYHGNIDNPIANCGSGNSSGGGAVIPGGSGAGSGINVPFFQDAYGGDFSGHAVVLQDYGYFKGEAVIHASEGYISGFGGDYSARAYGTFTDTLTLSATNGASGLGYLQFSFTITGSTAKSSSTSPGYVADARMFINVSTTGKVDPNLPAVIQGNGYTGSIYSAGTYTTSDPKGMPFYFGLPVEISVLTDVAAGVGYDRLNPPATFAGDAAASFLHTAVLSGINVFDAFGNQINSFTIDAASGTQYPLSAGSPATVPEPESYLMLLTGLGLLHSRLKANKKRLKTNKK